MEIRHIPPEENIHTKMLRNMVFPHVPGEDFTEKLKNPLAYSEGYENVWGGFDDNHRLMSAMVVNPYKVMFDGHVVDMGGIGGVVTRPEARRAGYIRGIFDRCFTEMYEKGVVFSYLYPFSTAFYRRFGYELSYNVMNARIPVASLAAFPKPKSEAVSLYEPGSGISAIKSIYYDFVADKNLAVARSDDDFRAIIDKDPYLTKQYTYIHNDGKPGCYAVVTAQTDNEGNTLVIKELAWNCTDSMREMLGFLSYMSPQFAYIKWDAPDCVNVPSLVPESDDVKLTSYGDGMNRIVNVHKALERMRYPGHLPGRAVISITDSCLPMNTGVYALEWDQSGHNIKKLGYIPDNAADLVTDIGTITQLITGYMDIKRAALKGTILVNGAADALKALFPMKSLYMFEKF